MPSCQNGSLGTVTSSGGAMARLLRFMTNCNRGSRFNQVRLLLWAGFCYSDYAFHTILLGKIAPERPGEFAEGCRLGRPRSRCSPPTSPRVSPTASCPISQCFSAQPCGFQDTVARKP